MVTENLVKAYFQSIHDGDWESYVSNDITYVVLDSADAMKGKDFYLKGAGQFFSLSTALETKQLIIQGNEAAAINRYTLQSLSGAEKQLDVGEFLSFNETGKLTASSIFFDAQTFKEFIGQT
ncbi:hypothetical protein [Oceanobacillus neutriphilus]|uniref:SnoaL-like domain-containing protein n=1 Tax=Oceanobacillus neutriphilus TaxID=531815 RepID=A0ABQ2P1H4_9BACI|nr:hypothetical protein [Oceanobacillus neutriphilus]GGP15935.1 hypothetical protein GCM10011346_45740 [Oceanobacillus neutriphilus]